MRSAILSARTGLGVALLMVLWIAMAGAPAAEATQD